MNKKFVVEFRGSTPFVVYENGTFIPASDEEVVLWKEVEALKAEIAKLHEQRYLDSLAYRRVGMEW